MHANGRRPCARLRAPDGTALQDEHHGPEQNALHRLVPRHASNFVAHTEADTDAEVPQPNQVQRLAQSQASRGQRRELQLVPGSTRLNERSA